MIRDTFETNPGLSELFKRKIIERARFVGLSEGLIDFEAQIDKKGTYQDNLRTFYREYPQLTQNSDYFRIASIRPLSGAALEQAWRSFQDNSRHETTELIGMPTEQSPTAGSILPQHVLTYTFGESVTERNEGPKEPEPIPNEPTLPQAETNTAASPHGELVRSILDRVSAMAGEKVTRAILHQIGLEIGRTEFHYSRDRMLPEGNSASWLGPKRSLAKHFQNQQGSQLSSWFLSSVISMLTERFCFAFSTSLRYVLSARLPHEDYKQRCIGPTLLFLRRNPASAHLLSNLALIGDFDNLI